MIAPTATTVTVPRLARWMVVWFVVSAVIQIYDAVFVLLGPLSHAGGPLAGLWPGHLLYAQFDHRYANFDAFGTAQSALNLVEAAALFWAVARRRRFSGVVLGLIVSVATFWKTVLYFGVEISSGLAMTRQSVEDGNIAGFLGIAVLPNTFWLVIPACVIISLARRLVRLGDDLQRA
ncbi:hypothetical protein [Microbacterium sp.]|uniref:hypothetical protein n=1 Tax=Microbacterium sp. TaxID=51671 RepID=UPI003C7864D6